MDTLSHGTVAKRYAKAFWRKLRTNFWHKSPDTESSDWLFFLDSKQKNEIKISQISRGNKSLWIIPKKTLEEIIRSRQKLFLSCFCLVLTHQPCMKSRDKKTDGHKSSTRIVTSDRVTPEHTKKQHTDQPIGEKNSVNNLLEQFHQQQPVQFAWPMPLAHLSTISQSHSPALGRAGNSSSGRPFLAVIAWADSSRHSRSIGSHWAARQSWPNGRISSASTASRDRRNPRRWSRRKRPLHWWRWTERAGVEKWGKRWEARPGTAAQWDGNKCRRASACWPLRHASASGSLRSASPVECGAGWDSWMKRRTPTRPGKRRRTSGAIRFSTFLDLKMKTINHWSVIINH